MTDELGPEMVDPDGNPVRSHTVFTYDAAGRVKTRVEGASGADAVKQMTAYEYDAVGRRWRTVTHTDGYFDAASPTVLHSGDRVVETRYTLGGRTAEEVTSPPGATSLDWEATGDGATAVTSYGYDDAGRRVGMVST